MLRFACFALLLIVVTGCETSVGTHCSDADRAAARTLVYDSTGAPAYAGQAIMLRSCAGGGSFCHVENALDRYGAPADLDLDPIAADDPRFTDEMSGAAHLLASQVRIEHYRDDIYSSVVHGSMPPGQAGIDIQPAPYIQYASAADTVGTPLPDVSTPEASELLRVWLACGAPVIEASSALPTRPCSSNRDCMPLALCDLDASVCVPVGDVAARRTPSTVPTWSSIYTTIVMPTCATEACHGAMGAAFAGNLELSSSDGAYAALVGVPSSSGCGDRVVASSPDTSLLIAKLEATQSTDCGEMMPPDSSLDPSQVAAVRAWVAAGADND